MAQYDGVPEPDDSPATAGAPAGFLQQALLNPDTGAVLEVV